jgi:hypothetical protein
MLIALLAIRAFHPRKNEIIEEIIRCNDDINAFSSSIIHKARNVGEASIIASAGDESCTGGLPSRSASSSRHIQQDAMVT